MSKNLDMILLLDFYSELLTPKQRDIMELYYYEDLSLAEIAENENITRQCVHDFIKRSEQNLCEFEKKLSLAEKSLKLKNNLNEIRKIAQQTACEPEHEKIYSFCCRIIELADESQNFI